MWFVFWRGVKFSDPFLVQDGKLLHSDLISAEQAVYCVIVFLFRIAVILPVSDQMY